jgi:hypothetical protein
MLCNDILLELLLVLGLSGKIGSLAYSLYARRSNRCTSETEFEKVGTAFVPRGITQCSSCALKLVLSSVSNTKSPKVPFYCFYHQLGIRNQSTNCSWPFACGLRAVSPAVPGMAASQCLCS